MRLQGKKTEEDFLDFYSKMPEMNRKYEEMGYMASFLNWSSIVRPDGFLKREAMYMSKNWMTNVWSWDNCFNALALSYKNPSLAWDTYIIMADFQDISGRIPIVSVIIISFGITASPLFTDGLCKK